MKKIIKATRPVNNKGGSGKLILRVNAGHVSVQTGKCASSPDGDTQSNPSSLPPLEEEASVTVQGEKNSHQVTWQQQLSIDHTAFIFHEGTDSTFLLIPTSSTEHESPIKRQ